MAGVATGPLSPFLTSNPRTNMNYTAEELDQFKAAILAHQDGNPVEYKFPDDKNWNELDTPSWNLSQGVLYRPKPQPKRVPWSKPEHVPGPVCWLRWPDEPENISMIVGMDADGVTSILGKDTPHFERWSSLRGQEYSTDRKTWHPCETEQPA